MACCAYLLQMRHKASLSVAEWLAGWLARGLSLKMHYMQPQVRKGLTFFRLRHPLLRPEN
jgi:hypothetical protein